MVVLFVSEIVRNQESVTQNRVEVSYIIHLFSGLLLKVWRDYSERFMFFVHVF